MKSGVGRLLDLGDHRRDGRRGLEVVDLVLGGGALLVRVLAPAGQVRLEVVGADQILDVEERGALLAHVDERGLEAGEHARDAAEGDVADRPRAGVTAALDVELGDDAVFDERDARLFDVNRDDERILGHCGTELSRPNAQRASLPRPAWTP